MPRSANPNIRKHRQRQILQAARDVFAKDGFDSARMDDVADASGLSKGTLYLYYKSKDDLIAGLLKTTFNDLLVQLRALLEIDKPVETRLLDYAQQMTSYMHQDASTLNIAYEFYAVAARQPNVRRLLQTYFADYRGALTKLLEQGIQRGEFSPFNTAQAAMTLIALLEGLTLLWFTDPDAVQLETVLSAALRDFFARLKG
ncbi:MAG: TetR/AcrR family transcriptional regulator [Anaerolineae bacterium]|nr:TetR/AcrR family transcriptional regulator [Anaerolineae bacterium]